MPDRWSIYERDTAPGSKVLLVFRPGHEYLAEGEKGQYDAAVVLEPDGNMHSLVIRDEANSTKVLLAIWRFVKKRFSTATILRLGGANIGNHKLGTRGKI